MSLKRLRKSDIRTLEETLPITLDKKDNVLQGDDVILINDELAFIKDGNAWLPALPLLQQQPLLPRVVVDMGAVPHVARGADIMRPGITSFPDADKDAVVVIVDERHGKPLAVGRLLADTKTLEESTSGKAVETLHHVGDHFWKEFAH